MKREVKEDIANLSACVEIERESTERLRGRESIFHIKKRERDIN